MYWVGRVIMQRSYSTVVNGAELRTRGGGESLNVEFRSWHLQPATCTLWLET
jgi:hypothetical protein